MGDKFHAGRRVRFKHDGSEGKVLFTCRRHRGPSHYIVLWDDGVEGDYERDELEVVS